MTRTILFWDIDGTLLTTARAGVLALEDACREVTGHTLDLQAIKSDGLTDHQLTVKILEQAGRKPTTELVERFLRHHESRLPHRLPQRRGRVLDGIREALAYLRERRPDIHSMLLTGNTAAGARAKLAHYGLQKLFDGGAFSEDTGPRAGIAVRALASVREKFPEAAIEPGHIFVIGDTPHDIDAARAIGARCIAVATGAYPQAALEAHGAWMVLERVPDPPAFEALIDSGTAVKHRLRRHGSRRLSPD
ncbi:MAG: haloacid dehalogenase-like hydrolase [Acidobacteriota bacterium]